MATTEIESDGEFVRLHEGLHASEQAAIDRERIGHEKQHNADKVALEAALTSEQRRLAEHQIAHEAAHQAHSEMHKAEGVALSAALEAEQRRLAVHNTAHDHAHTAHESVHKNALDAHNAMHSAEDRAVNLAQMSMDKRLDGMNEFRDQLRDQASTFVGNDQFDAFVSQYERAHQEVVALIATEREERRANEGKDKGQSSTVAWIFAGLGAASTILAMIIIFSNFATASP